MTSVCPSPSPYTTKRNLSHTQQREEFLIEQYTQVLEALEDQYSRISNLLLDVEKESFEGKVLGELLDSIKEAMRRNDRDVTEGRRELWRAYWEEEAGEGAGLEGREHAGEGGGGQEA
ncbi:hypothetical protein VTL71DRAFT_8343 [Oculimacula yallundae]|uniref:Uncharacterized protein n=1 Tax=Oculimacula yallundae TaxID=86028 RepID=A0ABR4CXE4_9HELO